MLLNVVTGCLICYYTMWRKSRKLKQATNAEDSEWSSTHNGQHNSQPRFCFPVLHFSMTPSGDMLIELRYYVLLETKQFISETHFSANLLA